MPAISNIVASALSDAGFTVTCTTNAAKGTAYMVVVAQGETAPSRTQIKAGNNYLDAPALASESIGIDSTTINFSAVIGLSSYTPYDVYIIQDHSIVYTTTLWSHVKTYGFNYQSPPSNEQIDLIAARHDSCIGIGAPISTAEYNRYIAANANADMQSYFAYHSQNPINGKSIDWMTQWCTDNALDPEDMFYHCRADTTISVSSTERGSGSSITGLTLTNPAKIVISIAGTTNTTVYPQSGDQVVISGINSSTHQTEGQTYTLLPAEKGTKTDFYLYSGGVAVDGSAWDALSTAGSYAGANNESITIAGFGTGYATDIFQSRLIAVQWNGGWPAVCPQSTTWHRASEAYMLSEQITLTDDAAKFMTSTFLDTFDGIIGGGGADNLVSNSIEQYDHFGYVPTQSESYTKAWLDVTTSYTELLAAMKTSTGNSNFIVVPNASDVDGVYQWRVDYWKGALESVLPYWSIEYMLTSGDSKNQITRLQEVFVDLVAGKKIFIRSQTNNIWPDNVLVTYKFRTYLMAAHYCINHDNAWFFLHGGTPSNYGGVSDEFIDPLSDPLQGSHWFSNQSIDIGTPVERAENNYWGDPDTDYFYDFDPAHPSTHIILAREYTNALVLARFGSGGIANIGNNPTSITLGGAYYPLQDDNTTGASITSISLGQSEGAILMKAAI